MPVFLTFCAAAIPRLTGSQSEFLDSRVLSVKIFTCQYVVSVMQFPPLLFRIPSMFMFFGMGRVVFVPLRL